MFEPFTDRTRRVPVLAQEEARLLSHSFSSRSSGCSGAYPSREEPHDALGAWAGRAIVSGQPAGGVSESAMLVGPKRATIARWHPVDPSQGGRSQILSSRSRRCEIRPVAQVPG